MRAASKNAKPVPIGELPRVHVNTEFATQIDLLDHLIDKGIVIEVWDRLGLAAIDMAEMRVTISVLQLFARGKNPPFRQGNFRKVEL